MAMNEYDLYTLILSPHFQVRDQSILIEDKLHKPHKASIVSNGVKKYMLYRFDMDKQNFLPFFNNTHDGEYGKAAFPAPKGLLKFCDYILLAVYANKLYVILIEMKSGDAQAATQQLHATADFMEYVRQTAVRVSGLNNYKGFSGDTIVVRKVILRPTPKAKPTTNVAKSSIDWQADTVSISTDLFPILKLCKSKR